MRRRSFGTRYPNRAVQVVLHHDPPLGDFVLTILFTEGGDFHALH